MKPYILIIALFALLLPTAAAADTIYRWTDDQGVERFSNNPPPEGVTDFEKLDTSSSAPENNGSERARRNAYDRMVEQASEEAKRLEKERKEKEAAQEAEKKRLADERRKKKIEAERKRLEKEIEAIKMRAVSPTYPQGMKQAQIDKITKQIEELEKTP